MSTRWRLVLYALILTVVVETGLLLWPRNATPGPAPTPAAEMDRPTPLPPDQVATALIGRPIYPTAIQSLAYAPDGRSIVAGDGLGRIIVFDRVHKTTRQFQAHSNWVFSLRFDTAGKQLLSAGGDNRVRISNWPDLSEDFVFDGHQKDAHAAAFLDGTQVVSAGDDLVLRVWSPSKTSPPKTLTGHTEPVTTLDVSADGRWIATGSRDDSVRIWDTIGNFSSRELRQHTNDVMAVRFLPDDKHLASTGYDGQLLLWRVADGQIVKRATAAPGQVFALAIAPNGKLAATGGAEGLVCLWHLDRDDSSVISEHSQRTAEGDISSLAFAPNASELAAGSTTGNVYIWNLTNQWNQWISQELSSPFRP